MAYHMDSELEALAGEVRAMSIYQGNLRAHSNCRDPDHPGCANCDGSREEAEYEAAEHRKASREAFLAACRAGDATALAPWAPRVPDTSFLRSVKSYSALPLRQQTQAEVMCDGMESIDVNYTELMQLLLNVAHGENLVNAPANARELLERMATAWVDGAQP